MAAIVFCKTSSKIFRNLKSSEILTYLRKIDTIFEKTIVYEGLQHGCKQKSVSLLVKDLET